MFNSSVLAFPSKSTGTGSSGKDVFLALLHSSKLRRAHSVDWAVLVGGFGCAMAVNSSSVKANLFFESKHSGAVPVLFIFKMNIVFVWLERRTRCYSNSLRSLLRVAYNIAIG